jgi:hypothetical protein
VDMNDSTSLAMISWDLMSLLSSCKSTDTGTYINNSVGVQEVMGMGETLQGPQPAGASPASQQG